MISAANHVIDCAKKCWTGSIDKIRLTAMAMPATDLLPDEIDALKAIIAHDRATHTTALSARDEEIERLRSQLRLLLAQRFGAKSERVEGDSSQLGLFDEAEVDAAAETEEDSATVTTVAGHTRARGHRRPLPAHLPREEIIHDLLDADKICPRDGTRLEVMGEEASEQLDIVPASIRVLHHRRLKYACPCCRQHVVTAPMPAQPIPKSQASAGLLASVATAKYADAQPLYRQSTQFERIGFDASRQTLARWMVQCGDLVQPLINLLRDRLLESAYIRMDETTVQVLKEPGKTAQSTSYLWVQQSGEREHPVVLYDYAPSRAGAVPVALLGSFNGYLQTDGYAGYHAVVAANGITPLYCFAHARRYFIEALKALGLNPNKLPLKPPDKARRPLKALGFIRHLYAIEHRIREASPAERLTARQADSVPVLHDLRAWLVETIPKVVPGSPLGKALGYLDRHWDGLIRYCEDGRLEIDNNRCENAIRPFVTGRKNWLFSDTVKGARSSANLFSLIETAKANGLEPYAYLRHAFSLLPAATTVADIEALLPWATPAV
jgi:transposase